MRTYNTSQGASPLLCFWQTLKLRSSDTSKPKRSVTPFYVYVSIPVVPPEGFQQNIDFANIHVFQEKQEKWVGNILNLHSNWRTDVITQVTFRWKRNAPHVAHLGVQTLHNLDLSSYKMSLSRNWCCAVRKSLSKLSDFQPATASPCRVLHQVQGDKQEINPIRLKSSSKTEWGAHRSCCNHHWTQNECTPFMSLEPLPRKMGLYWFFLSPLSQELFTMRTNSILTPCMPLPH